MANVSQKLSHAIVCALKATLNVMRNVLKVGKAHCGIAEENVFQKQVHVKEIVTITSRYFTREAALKRMNYGCAMANFFVKVSLVMDFVSLRTRSYSMVAVSMLT